METAASGSWLWELFKLIFGGFVGAIFALYLPLLKRIVWGPKLKLFFGSDIEGCVAKTPISDKIKKTEEYYIKKTEGYYIRIKIENIKPNLAKECRAFLVGIEKMDADGFFQPTIYQDSIQLQWSCRSEQGFSAIDLPQGINQFVDIISTNKDTGEIKPVIEIVPYRYENLFSEQGTFRYTIQVSGQDVKPQFIRFIFKWQGQWDNFEVKKDDTPFPQKTKLQELLEKLNQFLSSKFNNISGCAKK